MWQTRRQCYSALQTFWTMPALVIMPPGLLYKFLVVVLQQPETVAVQTILNQGTQQRIGSIKRGPSEDQGPGKLIDKVLFFIFLIDSGWTCNNPPVYCSSCSGSTNQSNSKIVEMSVEIVQFCQGMGKTLEQGNQGKTTKSFSF